MRNICSHDYGTMFVVYFLQDRAKSSPPGWKQTGSSRKPTGGNRVHNLFYDTMRGI